MDSFISDDTRGPCPHCGTYIKVIFETNWDVQVEALALHDNGYEKYRSLRIGMCPKCRGFIIDAVDWENTRPDGAVTAWHRVHPTPKRNETPTEVPAAIRRDYAEALSVAALSPRSAAALARRCLQAALHDKGFKANTLVKEIESAEAAGGVPSTLVQKLHIVRMVGNYAVHETSTTVGDLLEVEPGEVEALMAALDEFFDHFYVKPAQHEAMLKAVNAKLTAANKPPIR